MKTKFLVFILVLVLTALFGCEETILPTDVTDLNLQQTETEQEDPIISVIMEDGVTANILIQAVDGCVYADTTAKSLAVQIPYAGKYEVTITRDGYYDFHMPPMFELKSNLPLTISLVKKSMPAGKLKIQTQVPAFVYNMNSGLVIMVSPGEILTEPGEYNLQIYKQGYMPADTAVIVEDKGETIIVIDLKERTDPFGYLKVDAKPNFSKITVTSREGKPILVRTGSFNRIELPIGQITVIAEADNYYDTIESAEIYEGEITELNFDLEPMFLDQISRIVLHPDWWMGEVGECKKLTVELIKENGQCKDITAEVTFTSSDKAVVSINNQTAFFNKSGFSIITAEYKDGIVYSDESAFLVKEDDSSVTLFTVGIFARPNSIYLEINESQSIKVIEKVVNLEDATIIENDVTSEANFNSADTIISLINNTIAGLNPGKANINVSYTDERGYSHTDLVTAKVFAADEKPQPVLSYVELKPEVFKFTEINEVVEVSAIGYLTDGSQMSFIPALSSSSGNLLISNNQVRLNIFFNGIEEVVGTVVHNGVEKSNELYVFCEQPQEPATTLTVNTNPDNAHIYLSGCYLGLSPLSNAEVDFGDGQALKIKKDGYLDIDTTINIEKGLENVFEFNLKEKPKTFLEIETNVDSVLIFMDRYNYMGTTDNKKLEFEVEPGLHYIEAVKDGYKTANAEINCIEGEINQLYLELEKKEGDDTTKTVKCLVEVDVDDGLPNVITTDLKYEIRLPADPVLFEVTGKSQNAISGELLILTRFGKLDEKTFNKDEVKSFYYNGYDFIGLPPTPVAVIFTAYDAYGNAYTDISAVLTPKRRVIVNWKGFPGELSFLFN